MTQKAYFALLILLTICFAAMVTAGHASDTRGVSCESLCFGGDVDQSQVPDSQDKLANHWGTISRETPLSTAPWSTRVVRDFPVRQNYSQIDSLRHLVLGFSAWLEYVRKEHLTRSAATVSPLLAGQASPIFLALCVLRN
ncbi:MAG: hypothetical protein Q4G68_12905 [Planctomycetia bacterium]|nr:hypothetical protein [Planctomycetia bacterium]